MSEGKRTHHTGGKSVAKKHLVVNPTDPNMDRRRRKIGGGIPATQKWSTYIYRVFKETAGSEFTMKQHTATVFNGVANDMIDRIGTEAGLLCRHTRSKILRVRDVAAAVSLVTGNTELSSVMLRGGYEAVKNYQSSLGTQS